jgi:hypothetical protein
VDVVDDDVDDDVLAGRLAGADGVARVGAACTASGWSWQAEPTRATTTSRSTPSRRPGAMALERTVGAMADR